MQLATGTIELRFTANSVTGEHGLLSRDSSGFDGGGHVTIFIRDGALQVRIQDTVTTHAINLPGAIQAGQEAHVAVVFGEAGGFTVYLDGVAQATDPYTGGIAGNTEPVVVGGVQWRSGDAVADVIERPFDGVIETARIFDVALDATQVADLAAGAEPSSAPDAVDDVGFVVDAGVDLRISFADLLANDTDPNGDALTLVSVSGDAVIDAVNEEVVFNTATLGAQSFTYTVEDPDGLQDTATVSVDVTEPNVAPVAGDDAGFTAVAGREIRIPFADLLANDSDANTVDTLSIVSVTGAVLDAVTQEVVFTAGAVAGSESFTYTIEDSAGAQDTATVSVDVVANSAPVAGDDGPLAVREGTELRIPVADLLANDSDADGDALVITGVTGAVLDAVTDEVVFTAGAPGAASFTYTVEDVDGAQDTATVSLDVVANVAPVAGDDGPFTVGESGELRLAIADLLANDSDPDGATVSLVSVTGAVIDGTDVVFTAPATAGAASFSYTIEDADGAQDTATVSVDVLANQPPVAVDDAGFGVQQGGELRIPVATLLANDSDPENTALTLTAVSGTGVSLDTNTNEVVVTGGTLGAQSFSYTVTDADGVSSQADVFYTVVAAGPTGPTPILSQTGLVIDNTIADAVIIADDPSFQLSQGTVEVRFTPDTLNGTDFLVSRDSSGFDAGGHFALSIVDGRVQVRMQDTSGSFTSQTPNGLLTAGQEAHVAVVFGEAGGFTVYVDGVAQATNPYTGGWTSNNEPIVLGADQGRSGDGVADDLRSPFDGTISEFNLYDSALDAGTVAALAAGANANADPVAQDDSGFLALIGQDLEITAADLLVNDSDANGDTVTITAVTGDATLNANGTITFNSTTAGTQTFTYTIDDGNGGTDTATVTVNVSADTPANDPPTATDDAGFTVVEESVLRIPFADLLANDTDPDQGEVLTITA
ncbi:MAG: cadherin-like domain-containing protein, partial [Planctomycetota bacterium]